MHSGSSVQPPHTRRHSGAGPGPLRDLPPTLRRRTPPKPDSADASRGHHMVFPGMVPPLPGLSYAVEGGKSKYRKRGEHRASAQSRFDRDLYLAPRDGGGRDRNRPLFAPRYPRVCAGNEDPRIRSDGPCHSSMHHLGGRLPVFRHDLPYGPLGAPDAHTFFGLLRDRTARPVLPTSTAGSGRVFPLGSTRCASNMPAGR